MTTVTVAAGRDRRDDGLSTLFAPRSIAVIGATEGDERPGGRVLANLINLGYQGGVYPVARSRDQLHGMPCYQRIADVPGPVDLAVLCVGAARVAATVAECGQHGVGSAVVCSGGFDSETAPGRALIADLRAARVESGIRVLGPNSLGFRVVQSGLFATFSHDIEMGIKPGSIAMISQSGGLGGYFGAAYLQLRGAGSRYVVDTGNELDLDAAEVLEYIATDDEVNAVALILEGTRRGRRLASAVRTAVDRGKTVLFLHLGRSRRGAQQIASHTGSLAATAGLFEVALRDAGARIVADEGELVDALALLDSGRAPAGPRIGVVSASGGFAILSLDSAERFGVELPQPVRPPVPADLAALACGQLANPYDYGSLGPAGPDTLRASLSWMAGQPNLDAVVLWQAHGLYAIEGRRQALLDALDRVLPDAGVPIYGCGVIQEPFRQVLRDRGVLWFEEPTRLVRAIATTARRRPGIDSDDPPLAEPTRPDHHPTGPTPGGTPRSEPLGHDAPDRSVIVGAPAQRLLACIEHVRTAVVESAEQARQLADEWGQIVLKVESPRHPHKTEYGLVSSRVAGADVAAAYQRVSDARSACGVDEIPISAQAVETGVEVAMGGFVDPAFGPVLMVGMGGIMLEVIRDTVFALAPVSQAKARAMILRLRGSALLRGVRGGRPADIDALAAAAAAFSEFLADNADVYESIDINPVIVRERHQGVVAVDALLVPAPIPPGGEPALQVTRSRQQWEVSNGAG